MSVGTWLDVRKDPSCDGGVERVVVGVQTGERHCE